MINATYYVLKRRLGGVRLTLREKLINRWSPTPGFIMHSNVIGTRRGKILFNRYSNISYNYGRGANRLYWRSHPDEWREILRQLKHQVP